MYYNHTIERKIQNKPFLDPYLTDVAKFFSVLIRGKNLKGAYFLFIKYVCLFY